jgi:hypothetical protein
LLQRGRTVLGIGRSSNPSLGGERYEFVEFDFANVAELDNVLSAPLQALRDRPLASVCLVNNAASRDALGQIGRLLWRQIATAMAEPGGTDGADESVLPSICGRRVRSPDRQRLLGRGAAAAPGPGGLLRRQGWAGDRNLNGRRGVEGARL